MACKKEFLRQMPGRIAGQTVDKDGRRGFVLTLSTREQHIRRERATSNICTNQALCALRATIFMETLGKQGLREMAWQNVQKAAYAADRLAAVPGVKKGFTRAGLQRIRHRPPQALGRGRRRRCRRRASSAASASGRPIPSSRTPSSSASPSSGRRTRSIAWPGRSRRCCHDQRDPRTPHFRDQRGGQAGVRAARPGRPRKEGPAGRRGPAPQEIEDFPEVSETEIVRHFTRLSQKNYCVDLGLYPLGSCTMKYNPKINERLVGPPRVRRLASARARRPRPGRTSRSSKRSRAFSARSPAWTPSRSSRRPGPTAS